MRRWRASPRPPAAARARSSQDRDRAGHRARMGQGDVDLRAELGELAVQADVRPGLPAHYLDVLPRPRGQPERLGDGLLRAEARGEVLAGTRALGRVRALARGEEPLGERGAPLQRLLEALDLEKVDPGSWHGRG